MGPETEMVEVKAAGWGWRRRRPRRGRDGSSDDVKTGMGIEIDMKVRTNGTRNGDGSEVGTQLWRWRSQWDGQRRSEVDAERR